MPCIPRLLARAGPPALAAICSISVSSCVSMDTIAPPVTPALLSASRGHSAQTIEEGRRIFVGACTACHTADPVSAYSVEKWRIIVADMAERTKLTPTREAALNAYITAALSR